MPGSSRPREEGPALVLSRLSVGPNPFLLLLSGAGLPEKWRRLRKGGAVCRSLWGGAARVQVGGICIICVEGWLGREYRWVAYASFVCGCVLGREYRWVAYASFVWCVCVLGRERWKDPSFMWMLMAGLWGLRGGAGAPVWVCSECSTGHLCCCWACISLDFKFPSPPLTAPPASPSSSPSPSPLPLTGWSCLSWRTGRGRTRTQRYARCSRPSWAVRKTSTRCLRNLRRRPRQLHL